MFFFIVYSVDETVQIKQVFSLAELQQKLTERFIMTLATSPDNQTVRKMFLFAQHVSLKPFMSVYTCMLHRILLSSLLHAYNYPAQVSMMDFFFIEVIITDLTMRVTIKAENQKLTQNFKLHYFDTLSEYLV